MLEILQAYLAHNGAKTGMLKFTSIADLFAQISDILLERISLKSIALKNRITASQKAKTNLNLLSEEIREYNFTKH